MKYIKTFESLNGITFKEWLNKNPQDINIIKINVSNKNLIDLNGIEKFKNIERLYCSGNKLPYNDLGGYWKWFEKTYPKKWRLKQDVKKYNL